MFIAMDILVIRIYHVLSGLLKELDVWLIFLYFVIDLLLIISAIMYLFLVIWPLEVQEQFVVSHVIIFMFIVMKGILQHCHL